MFSDLRAFLDQLRRDRDLAAIEVPVDPHLEVAEIHRRVLAAGGPALLFTKVRDADFRLVTNLFGTARRAQLAFGSRPFDLIRRLVEVLETMMPTTPATLWASRDLARALWRVGTRRVRRGPVTEVVSRDVRLDRLPVHTSWAEDGGPFLTLGLVYTEHPAASAKATASLAEAGFARRRERRGHNLGIYRMQVLDRHTTAMHWQIGKGGGFHYAAAEARNERLPVTVFLGGPPALTLAAVAPLPENVPELLLASLIQGNKLPLCPGPSSHRLVATAEFALAGSVPPRARRSEGPFGDHYGYYSLRHDYPIFEVDAIAHRRDAILPGTVVGKPRQEDFFIGDLLQDLLSPVFPLVMPAVQKLWAYGETGYHSLAAAVVTQRYPREAMASAFRILGEGQLSLTKFLLVMDRPVDLRDFPKTLAHLLERTDPRTDLYVFSNLSMDTLDYTGPRVNEGSKGVWLGLGDPVRELPRAFAPTVEVPPDVTVVRVFCPGCLVVGARPYKEDSGVATRIAQHAAFAGWPLVVLTDEPARAAASPIAFLWTTFTRFEPAADIHAASRTIVRNHLAYDPPVVIDARIKPGLPKELACDPDTAALVTRRWKEYFPSGGVEMGDSDGASLI